MLLENISVQKKINKSREIIQRMLELSNNPYLALSFGKDSLVMLDLVREYYKDIPCLFLKSNESDYLHNFKEIENWYITNKSINLKVIETNRLAEAGWDYKKAQIGKKDDWFLDGFIRDNENNKYDGVFMGLRIEESTARRVSLLKKENNQLGKFIMQYVGKERKGLYRCCPVAHFNEVEILSYLQEKKLKYLDIYKFGSHIRTTARLPRESSLNESLFWIKKNDPERYRILKAKVKGI